MVINQGLITNVLGTLLIIGVFYYLSRAPKRNVSPQQKTQPKPRIDTISCAACGTVIPKKSSMVDLMHSHRYTQFLCPDCYNEASGRAWMPKLHGRPQQIKWANLIRLNALAANPQNRLLHTQKDAVAWIEYHESLSSPTKQTRMQF